MIRKMLQSALCLCLSPLLVAQQVSQEAIQQAGTPTLYVVWAYPTLAANAKYPAALSGMAVLPPGAAVKLIPLDSLSSATATIGATVHLAVAQDVVVSGIPALRAGTSIECRITKVRRGRFGNRDGASGLRVKEVAVGNSVRLRLTVNPQKHGGRVARNVLTWTLRGIAIAALLPLFALYFLFWIPVLLNCKDGC